jgi:hypothetical protein
VDNDDQDQPAEFHPRPPGWTPEPTFSEELAARLGAGIHPGVARCTGWSNRQGRQCEKPAIAGADKCQVHGAGAPQVRAAAAARVAEERAEAEATKIVAKLADSRAVANPLEELAKLAGEILAFKDVLRGKVDALTELDPGAERNKALLAAYERALDRASGFLIAYGRLDIDSRLARIREQFADVIIAVIDEALRDTGLTEQAPEVRRAAGRALRTRAVRVVGGS